MISALAYLQFHSVKNRLTQRIRRLKQPKYLVGAIVGGLYFYFYFVRFVFFPPGAGRGASVATAGMTLEPIFFESLGALVLFGIVLLAWVIPHQRAALTFTEPEVAFLFPAPISRQGLIHFKLLRSQLAILFTVFFLMLVSGRFSSGRGLIRAAGWWVMLFTLNLHFMGSSFALTRLMDRGISTWKRRVAVLGLVVVAAAVVIGWVVEALPNLATSDLSSVRSATDYFQQALTSGPLPYLLFPFRLVVRPYLAADWGGFLLVIGPALGMMVLHYFWVVRADVAFEEASVESSKRLAEKVAAARSGNWRTANRKFKVKRPPFELRPGGSPLVALLWKNLISAGSAFTLRLWIIVMISVGVMALALRGTLRDSNWVIVLGSFTGILGVWTLFFGPQVMRQDLRQDLPNADWLKLFPLRGWQVAFGEILAPAVILTALHWALLLVTLLCSGPMVAGKLAPPMVLAIAGGIAIILPALNLISLLIPNAAVLLFPAWFQTGKESLGGIEATGQRLIFAIGQFLAFALSLIPAATAFLLVYFVLGRWLGAPVLAVPVAAGAATLVLGAEAALGLMLLGKLFERFDLSKEAT